MGLGLIMGKGCTQLWTEKPQLPELKYTPIEYQIRIVPTNMHAIYDFVNLRGDSQCTL